MKRNKIIFFRNDDVGLYSNGSVSPELINLTDIFIKEKVPVSYGVVPGEVNEPTVNWLKTVKTVFPHLIGIDQHGYRHVDYGCGEFGNNRTYETQREDINAGRELIKEYFGNVPCCFIPPWNKYNSHTKQICDELGFKVFSGAVSPKLHARTFVKMGQFLNLNVMLGKPVSYHRKSCFSQPGLEISEISVGLSVVENYKSRKVKSFESINSRYKRCKKYFDCIGCNLHHWVFDSPEKLNIIQRFLVELKEEQDISFKRLEDIASLNGSCLQHNDNTVSLKA